MYAIEKPEIDKSQFETIIEEINEENIPPNTKVLRSSLNREAPKYNSTKAEEQVDALRKPLELFSPVRAAMKTYDFESGKYDDLNTKPEKYFPYLPICLMF